jgi:hypothetical protein
LTCHFGNACQQESGEKPRRLMSRLQHHFF